MQNDITKLNYIKYYLELNSLCAKLLKMFTKFGAK